MNEQTKLVEKVKNYFPKINADILIKPIFLEKKLMEVKKELQEILFFHIHLKLPIYLRK